MLDRGLENSELFFVGFDDKDSVLSRSGHSCRPGGTDVLRRDPFIEE